MKGLSLGERLALIKTFPEWTVYLYIKDGNVQRANTSSYYINLGKSYEECKEAIKTKHPTDYVEVQNQYLYQVTLLLEKAQKELTSATSRERILDELNNISFSVASLITDLEAQEQEEE